VASVMMTVVYAVFIEVRSRACPRLRMFHRLAAIPPRMYRGCWAWKVWAVTQVELDDSGARVVHVVTADELARAGRLTQRPPPALHHDPHQAAARCAL
jgi:hypothetical protein